MRGSYEPVPAFECNPCLWMLVPKRARGAAALLMAGPVIVEWRPAPRGLVPLLVSFSYPHPGPPRSHLKSNARDRRDLRLDPFCGLFVQWAAEMGLFRLFGLQIHAITCACDRGAQQV